MHTSTTTKRVLSWGAAVLLGLAVALPAAAHDGQKGSRVPLPAAHARQGDKCVEPTEVMRRDHMDMILHQRDETMHRGIRTVKHSLKGCVDCHADPKTGSVLGKDGFCAACHAYTAVSIDCFSCHTDKAGSKPAGLVEGGAQPARGNKP
jgi:hypothetical protein